MREKLVATYKFGERKIEVYGCEGTGDNFEFFDAYLGGECINEGDPFYEKPSRKEVKATLDSWLDFPKATKGKR